MFSGVPISVGGVSPIAMVYGQTMEFDRIARDMVEFPFDLVIIIGVLQSGNADGVEDRIDGLVRKALLVLDDLKFTRIVSNAGAGVPQWITEGKVYRIERIVARKEDKNDD